MARAKGLNNEKIFRYWIEVRELATGSVRKLPLTAVRLVCLRRGKKNEPPLPDTEVLQLKDDAQTWEAETFDELRTRLRDKYPDAVFERTLHYVRDQEAEERREKALSELVDILARRVVDDLIAEESHVEGRPSPTA